MTDYNEVKFSGRLGKDAIARTTPSGNPVTTLSVCSEKILKNKTFKTWMNIILWGDAANIAADLKKGTRVEVSNGRIQNRSWEDKKNGQKRYTTEIVADSVKILSNPRLPKEHQEQIYNGYQPDNYRGEDCQF